MNYKKKENKKINILFNLKNSGFSTLFIVIILGIMSLALILNISISNTWSIKSNINSYNSIIAKALNNACKEIALQILRDNNNYEGQGTEIINNNTCTYNINNLGGNEREIIISS